MPTRRHRAWRPRSSYQGGYSESLCASRETERSVRDTLSRSLLLVRDGHAAAGLLCAGVPCKRGGRRRLVSPRCGRPWALESSSREAPFTKLGLSEE